MTEDLSTGAVAAIFVAVRSGEPVEAKAEARLIEGAGIEGDRYATKKGFWSDPQWPDQELTLVESELEDELGIERGKLRRNVVTRGIDVQSLIGRKFRIGETLLAGVRPCDPCRHIEELNRLGLLRDLAGRGGLRAHIIEGGTIRVGDTVEPVPEDNGP